MLFQRPYSTKGIDFFSKTSKENIVKITKLHLKNVSKTLKELPSSILLVLRNLNTIRSLNIELEEPCDFLLEMTRWYF